MKDVIEEQRQALAEKLRDLTGHLASDLGLRSRINLAINESFLKITNEADFIVTRMQGDAGQIEQAARRLPSVGKLLRHYAGLLRGYAARLESSQAPEVDPNRSKIITLDGNGS
jgi:hypothetical protein